VKPNINHQLRFIHKWVVMGIQWIPAAAPIPHITHPKHLKEKSFKAQGFLFILCSYIVFVISLGQGYSSMQKNSSRFSIQFFWGRWAGSEYPPPYYIPFFLVEKCAYIYIYIYGNLKIKFKGQIQCANTRIKVFDSSLTWMNIEYIVRQWCHSQCQSMGSLVSFWII
jgi:hypothetical protein